VRRWVVLTVFANLVAGALSNPLRAKQVQELLVHRDRLDSDSKEYEQVSDSLAELDPMCVYGRRWLLNEACDIYRQCRWTKP
jgi:hypothetical protein